MGDSNNISPTFRYTSLDGLRGLASLVVLVHHCFLISPQLAAAVDSNGTGPFESWVWWVTFTPVHLLWAGQEAVIVFFILSGFVLTNAIRPVVPTKLAGVLPKENGQDLSAGLGFSGFRAIDGLDSSAGGQRRS